jgi:hypothetical protein
MPESPQIFISHSRRDAAFAHELCAQLEAAGLVPWIDAEDIPAGSTWPREIEKAVEACAAMVVVMSEAARASEWVERETLRALELRKPVFIALIDDTRMPLHLLNRQYTDFRTRPEVALARLISALRAALRSAPPPPPMTVDPSEHHFFKYLEQLPEGPLVAQVARRLYVWAARHADAVTFSGRERPAFSASLWLGPGGLPLFSVRTYTKEPAVEIPLRSYASFPPYTDRAQRLAVLAALNSLLPPGETLADVRVNGRPNLPLAAALGPTAHAERFEALMSDIVKRLRAGQ